MAQDAKPYVLGSSDPEIERLDAQAAAIAPATRLLLRAAGIGPGMRVLDLGTGVGHVAMLLGDFVGPDGSVVGIDNDARMLAVAAERAHKQPQLHLLAGDVRDWRDGDDKPFDAVVGRLILFHSSDPLAVVRHHAAALRPGGLWLALDFDLGTSRSEPAVAVTAEALGWIIGAFRHAGADPMIGARLSSLLAQAGLAEVQGFGVQGYLAPGDARGPALLSGVVRSLVPKIIDAGLATAGQIDIDTLQARIAAAHRAAGSTVLPPALVGAWGRRR